MTKRTDRDKRVEKVIREIRLSLRFVNAFYQEGDFSQARGSADNAEKSLAELKELLKPEDSYHIQLTERL